MKKVEQLQTIQQVVLHCRRGDLNALQKALDLGFNVNTIDPVSTDSPLMIACRCGHPELVRLCLAYGAKNDPHPDFGQTALHAAVSEGQYYCAAVLLEVASQSDAAGIISNLSDSNGQTPLHVAATVGDINMIELLLSCDARISCVDVHGQTSLHLCGGSGNEACLAMLLDHSGDELLENEDINGNTVLHHASYNGHINCVRLLLETAANVMVCNHKGQTPYNLAQLRGHKDIVKLLTEYSDHHQQVLNSRPAVTPQKNKQQQHQQHPLSLATPTLKKPSSQQDVFSTPQQGASFLPRPPHTMASPTATSPRFYAPASVQRGPIIDPQQQQQQYYPPLPTQQHQGLSTPESTGYITARGTEDKSQQQQRGNGLTNSNAVRLDLGVEGIPVYTKQKIIQTIRPSGSSSNQLASPQPQASFQPTTPGGSELLSSHQVEIGFEDPSPEKHSSPYDEGGGRALASPPSTPAVKKNLNLQYDTSPSPTTYFDKHFSPPKPSQHQQQHQNQEYSETDETGYADPLEVFTALDITWHSYTTEDGHVYYLDMSGNNHSQWEDPRTHGIVHIDEYASYGEGAVSESVDDDQHQHYSHLPPKSPSPKAVEKIRNFGSHDERDDRTGLNQVVKKIDWDEVVAKNVSSNNTGKTEVKEERVAVKLKDSAAAFLKAQSKLDELKVSIKDELKAAEEEERQRQQRQLIVVESKSVVIDETRVQEYVELYKAGKSLLELRELMESRNESEAFLLHVFASVDEIDLPDRVTRSSGGAASSAVEEVPETINTSATANAPASEVVTVESLSADPTLGKYIRMSKMGVPVQNVLAKMKMEEVDIKQRNKVMVALGAEPEAEPGAGSGKNGGSKPAANFQTLHWNTLPAERLKNSIWSFNDGSNTAAGGAAAGGASGEGVADSEIQELEKLFASNARSTKEVCKVVDKQVIPLKILERKRAQNIAIGLVPFKVFGSHLDILKAICSLNTLDNRLTADHLDNFRNLLPTDAEMKRIHDIKGSKHPAELFIQTALLFYPELPKRLTSFAICLTFLEHCAGVVTSLKLVINCCNQVLSSSRLAKLLKKMLAIGNVMNQGTHKGQAAGFTLDSLLKMVNTKGVDNKTSLLDYVVKSLYDKGEQNVLAVVDDLNLVDKSSKLSDAEVLKEVEGISKNFKFLMEELQRNELNMSGNVLRSPTAKLIVNDFHTALQAYLHTFTSQVEEVAKWSGVMRRKVKEIVEYFGEDAGKCDTVKIFAVLQEFRTALLFSKESVEWKLRRASGSEV